MDAERDDAAITFTMTGRVGTRKVTDPPGCPEPGEYFEIITEINGEQNDPVYMGPIHHMLLVKTAYGDMIVGASGKVKRWKVTRG